MRREAIDTIRFRHYLRAHPWPRTTWYEMKQTIGTCLPFARVEEHQRNWLLACKHGTTNYKIPDDSRGVKPTDGVFTAASDAVIVVRYPKFFAVIDIDVFIEADKSCARRSLTDIHAREIAQQLIDLC